MATRNERRKAAKARNAERTKAIVAANAAYERALIVKRNLASPPPPNSYYPSVSCIGDMKAQSHRAYICRASGGMERGRALALKAQGKW